MSTQTRHGPHGLPEVYQVYIPEDRETYPIEEFNKIMKIAAPNCDPGGGLSGGWHKIENEDYICQHDEYLNIPEVSYEDWKKAILEEPDPVYSVGDEVELVSYTKGGSFYYTSSIGTKAKVISLTSKHWPNDTSRIGVMINGDECGWYKADIRHATPEEIEKATTSVGKYITPVVGKWYTCLDGYTNVSPEPSDKVYGGSGYEASRVFKCNDISCPEDAHKGGAILWYKDDHAGIYNRAVREATQEEIDIAAGKKKPAKDGKEWICTSEDGVELYDGDVVQWVKIDENRLFNPFSITKEHRIGDVLKHWKVFSTEQAAKDWIEQQNGTGWKVGDILSTKDLEKYPNYRGQNGERRKGISAQHFTKDRYVAEVKDGWALISGTINIWLPPKHQCTPLPVDLVKQVPVTTSEAKKWVPKVGDWATWKGNCPATGKIADKCYKFENCWRLEGGNTKDHTSCHQSYLRPATPEEIAKAQGTQIPVTAENAVIGMRVVRGKDWYYGDQDTEDGVQQVGTIVGDKSCFPIKSDDRWVRVQWDNGRRCIYRIGKNDYYDLYIASDNTVTKQSINNNQSIISQIKTKTNVNTEQKVRYTGAIVCSIVSEIRHTEIRRTSGIFSGNSKTLLGTSH